MLKTTCLLLQWSGTCSLLHKCNGCDLYKKEVILSGCRDDSLKSTERELCRGVTDLKYDPVLYVYNTVARAYVDYDVML